MPNNIETIRSALRGIVSKTEREEALAALEEVDFRISVLREALNSMSHWNGQSVSECINDAENTIRKLRKDNINDNDYRVERTRCEGYECALVL